MDPRRLALIRSGTAKQRCSLGSGYLIAPRLVLTARHVLVNRDTGEPWPEIEVRIGHPGHGDAIRAKAELLWGHPDGLDVALLRIEREMHVPGAVRWGRPVGKVPLRYEGLGFPRAAAVVDTREVEHLRGLLSPLSGSGKHYVLDQIFAPAPGTDGKHAWGGVSGAAIFCGDHLVGVVVHEPRAYDARRLFALPVHFFVQDGGCTAHLEKHAGKSADLIDIGAPLPKARPAAERTPVERELEKLLTPLLADLNTRAAHARDLARELGYEADRYDPTVADLSALLVTHPRALASLGGVLAAQRLDATARTHLTNLLFRAQILGCGSLLSLSEHEELLDLLRSLCKEHPTLLPWAAREALRYTVLPERLTHPHLADDDLDDVIEQMEALYDTESVPEGTPQVPALLRLVEYVAAASGTEMRAKLCAWSRSTAARLGIHPDALGERRMDATDWAKHQTSPVSRVVMELERDDSAKEQQYRCRILLVRMDGSHSVLHKAESTAKTPQQVAGSLREAVTAASKEPGQADHVPWVTVVVDKAGLHLAVDEWKSGALNDILPEQPIGAEYRVTLSCPEVSDIRPEREGDQKRRWKRGQTTALVTDQTCGNAAQLQHLLQTDHRNAAQVVLHGPADQRQSWLLVCLVLGVPVVLWDRDAVGYEDAARLRSLAPSGGLDGLPERVRVFRSNSVAYPQEQRAHPSLVWEPDGQYPKPESLQLRDPWKGTHAS
ncbi:trypsin-like serine protease [Streptomyces sp. NPDC039016]|uniref:VMAP-C domain-containing protein n=1 Tax=Streptomyces sp. NPDC039016 TaxID=3154330 RepID=UPI0033DD8089